MPLFIFFSKEGFDRSDFVSQLGRSTRQLGHCIILSRAALASGSSSTSFFLSRADLASGSSSSSFFCPGQNWLQALLLLLFFFFFLFCFFIS